MTAVYDFTAASLAGEEVPLKRFEGKVLLIVNTASACGFTPQYKGLEALHRELKYFVDCICNDKTPMNDGHAGLRVVRMLEAANESLRNRGAIVCL